MALGSITNLTFPNSKNSVDATDANKLALTIEEFTGQVEGTINRRSVLTPIIPVRSVKGTATFTNFAVGKSALQVVTPGTPLDGIKSDFSKTAVTIDKVMAAREFFPLLDVFQTQFDVRSEVAQEQGKEIAKFKDNTFLTMALKAARAAQSAYSGGTAGKPAGHGTGNVDTSLATAADAKDPAKLAVAIDNLLVKMEQQDVDPRNDGVIIVLKPEHYYTLLQNELLVNSEYLTAMGNQVNKGWVLKTKGVPVFSSNNLPSTNVTAHPLSSSNNGNAYNGDFTKTIAAVFGPRALMAGETIPVQSDIFYDKLLKSWVVDSHMAFAVGPNRVEYAGEVKLV